ncbi:MAG: T9SS type A sorting domain-containing protein [Candidatus Eisenbacteria bacterium]
MARHWEHLSVLALLALLPETSHALTPPVVPTYQFSWGNLGTALGQFDQPEAVAIDGNGDVYVADMNNNRVQKFGAFGNALGLLGGTQGFSSPQGIAVDRNNNDVFVLDTGGFGRVFRFDSSGLRLTMWNTGILATAVAVDDSDNVYVVSRPDTMFLVQKYSSGGTLLKQWRYGKSNDLTTVPNAITVDANFHVFAIDAGGKKVQEFNSVGVGINTIGSPGTGNGQFETPHGVAVDAFGDLYVTDWSLDRVQLFDPAGAYLGQWTNFTPNPPFTHTGPGVVGLYQPEGIALSPQGDVYVSEWGARRISRFSGSGLPLALVSGIGVKAYVWGSGFVQQPFGMAAVPGGDILVVDTGNNRVDNFFPNGTLSTTWGSAGTGNGQFNGPTGIGFTNTSNILVTDTGNNRVEVFSDGVAGTYVTQWGSLGSATGQFNVPFGIAVDGADTVDVVDQGNNRVQQFSGTGVFRTAWGTAGGGAGQFSAPYGIAIDAGHNVYVADAGNNRIEKFSATGTFLTQWGSLGAASGQFNGPHAVTVDAADNVYVGDQGNARIQKFSSAGAYLTEWPATGLPMPPPGTRELSSVASGGVDGLAVDVAGNIFFADGVANSLAKYVNPPAITLIADVPHDAGHRVRLHVHHCSTDAAGAVPQVTDYEIYRRIDPPGTTWEKAGMFPATGAADYMVDATTRADAAPGAIVYTLFKVRALTSNSSVYFESAPGYGYSINNGGAPLAVPVPRSEGLELVGARPNPTLGGPLQVAFSLSRPEPAALELFDIAGRRVVSREVGELGAGPHVVELAPAHRLAAGVYLVRLRQGANAQVARVTVLE